MSEKPLPPADGECCESACEPCVWDTYYEELREWKEEQKKKESDENQLLADKNMSHLAVFIFDLCGLKINIVDNM